MQKLYITIIFSLFISVTQTLAGSGIDSIGVENVNGKKVIIHKIASKDTYYALGRKYDVAPKDIIAYNDNKTLVPGVIVKVPTQRPFGVSTVINTPVKPLNSASPVNPASANPATSHTVKPKESLGIIARQYNTTVEELRKANNMTGSALSIGQVLKLPTTTANSPVGSVNPTVTANTPVSSVNPTATSTATNNTLVGSVIPAPYTDHTVKPKEYLNKIAEQYGITADAIKAANNLRTNNLSIGQVLRIPASGTANPSADAVVNTPTPTPRTTTALPPALRTGNTHTVATGETIFSIAQRYKLTAFQVREANSLANNDISVGQVLTIPGTAAGRTVTESARTTNADEPEGEQMLRDPNLRRDPAVYGLNQVEEKGIAVWIADPDLDASKMLVLHRTLPVGSVIMVKNPMANVSILAKVVGKFTENETTKDVIIVVTKAVADKLGVLDKRFFCNIIYAVQENEQ